MGTVNDDKKLSFITHFQSVDKPCLFNMCFIATENEWHARTIQININSDILNATSQLQSPEMNTS